MQSRSCRWLPRSCPLACQKGFGASTRGLPIPSASFLAGTRAQCGGGGRDLPRTVFIACLLMKLEESKSNGIVLEESKHHNRPRRAQIQGFSTLGAQDMAVLVKNLVTPQHEMTEDEQRLLKRARNRLSLCFPEDRLIVFAWGKHYQLHNICLTKALLLRCLLKALYQNLPVQGIKSNS